MTMAPLFVWRSAAASRTSRLRGGPNQDSFVDRPDLGLWAAADGMGGHRAGDIASRSVAEALARSAPAASLAAFLDAAAARLAEANAALLEAAREVGPDAVIGSTIAALLAHGRHAACLWAGDSRVYLLRDTQLFLLTRDHTLVQELVDQGSLDAAAAPGHPAANVVTRGVGVDPELRLERRVVELEHDDTFLLCSDGLTKVVTAEAIARTLLRDVEAAARELVELAQESGATDDVTVVVARIEEVA